jgi:hypothetical protein
VIWETYGSIADFFRIFRMKSENFSECLELEVDSEFKYLGDSGLDNMVELKGNENKKVKIFHETSSNSFRE